MSYSYKITLLGDSAVGKTSLVQRFVEDTFAEDYQPTLGTDFYAKSVYLPEIDIEFNLTIWDIAGQRSFREHISKYMSGSNGFILVYDLTRPPTLNNLHTSWERDLKEQVSSFDFLILIGNKNDLKNNRKIFLEDGIAMAKSLNACAHLEASALSGDNVNDAFKKITWDIYKNNRKKQLQNPHI